ncbi:unnamed protein product [Cryptosporidium hominis]|uniref:Uncharacterized protein n=1 Tax=Cryptosporidium hominis TaxID=237895 RepID=A0A0S4TE86_CRYHO|nr:hypothetical protein ChTU502y2012_401g0345 [Cryptosporidium hominis]PPA65195.1 hypothetical protein ChUKH1_15915 [Cryptosporidium hominis]CUV05172.1 unnamed protein product [Cryptosporidium hominis]
MFEVALIAAAECRIDDLTLLFNDPELRRYWKLILNSIPETLHIDQYKHIIPKPTNVQIGDNYEDNHLFSNEQNIFHDSIESISQWSIERCFHIVKNTLNISDFALPFLTFIIKHLGFEIADQSILLNNFQEKHLIFHFDSIIVLYSFYSILEQYCIAFERNIKFCKKILDPIKFILDSPINRFKLVIEQFSDSSYSELSKLFSSLFGSCYCISYLNSLYDKQLNKDDFESTKILRCQPLVQKYCYSGYFQQFYYKDANFIYKCENNLTSSLYSNAHVPLEESVINYLFDEKDNITIDLFCKISKILVKNSKLTNNLTNRFIACPIRVIQFILLCINGRDSPLLNVNALEIQEYIDEVYECTPKSSIIIKYLKKDLTIQKLNSSILKIDNSVIPSDYICCPFCKNVSVLYQGPQSIQSFRNWLNNIFFSIESIEKHQLFIDLYRELPIKVINEITIYDIYKVLYNPINAECFLINLISKLPTFYTTDLLNTVISIYNLITDSIRLPNYPLGSLLSLIFYLLEKLLIVENLNIEISTGDIVKQIKQYIISTNECEFMDLFLQLFNRIYYEYLEPPMYNFTIFINKLNKEIVLNNETVDFKFKLICEHIFISNIINDLIKYSPNETEIYPIFRACSKIEFEKLSPNLCNNFEFSYYYPNSIIFENNKERILMDIFLSNPSLTIINEHSLILDKLKFIIKKFLFIDEDHLIWKSIIKLQITTLIICGSQNLAIEILFNSVSNKEYIDEETIKISFYLIKNSEFLNGISTENNSLLNIIEKTLLSNSPLHFLSLLLNYKSTPIYDKNIIFNEEKIQSNLEKCFSSSYYYTVKDSNYGNTIFDLFFNNHFIKSDLRYPNLVFNNFNKYDLLIYCSADLLFNNGYKSKLIINSANVNQRTKILICLSLISILSIKNLLPRSLSSIKSLLSIVSTIRSYIQIIHKIRALISTKANVSKLLEYEEKVPIYLIKFNSDFSLKRWKMFLDILPFSDIVPLLHMIEEIYIRNNSCKKTNLFSYLEIYYLTENLITNYEYKMPIISEHHIKVFLNHPMYCYKTLLYIYTQSLEQESIRHVAVIIHLLVLKFLTIKFDKAKINDIHLLVENDQFRKFTKLFKLFPKYKALLIKQIIAKEKSITNLLNFSKIWNNYWLVLKFLKSINQNLISIFSFELLYYIFLKNERFPVKTYKNLILSDGSCISHILNDLLKNLSKDADLTIKFVEKLQNNKHKLDIITIIINHLSKDTQYDEQKKKLFVYLNNLLLTTKIILYLPNFENKIDGLQIVTYNQILKFILDLFMDSNDYGINILILNILRPLKINFFELLIEAIMLYLNQVIESCNNTSTEFFDFIKLIFKKENSNLFSNVDGNFCDFLYKIYNGVLYNMESINFSVIFSIELVSRNLFNVTLLNNLTNKVIANINSLTAKMNIDNNFSSLYKCLNGISKLAFDQYCSKKLNHIICDILYLLLQYTYVLDRVKISVFDENMQIRDSDNDKPLLECTISHKKIISEFALNVLSFILSISDERQFLKYWFLFGETLMESNDQVIFFDRNKKKLFIGLNSSFKKHILNSITSARMKEILASKYYKPSSYTTLELICSLNIILNSASYVFLGTRLFSNLIFPILMNTRREKDNSFILIGKRISNVLNIRYYDTEELKIIGVFLRTLLIYKKKLINYLIPQLFALKSENIVSEMVASESHILRYSHISSKYAFKILSKMFDKFYYTNFDSIRLEIENEISSDNMQNYLNSANRNLLDCNDMNFFSENMYQRLLTKFYTFLFGRKHHFLEFKLVEGKINII